ncbi:hypothetical protein T11_9053 [Trichinella zimbabwensis]|uniref:Uncharacterized protein n=1 Tax=Trichinella zimbabwensis TaxID=268475 RepID=A0A0V1GPR4_9BILA|nr:hypothetical protein T11_9053 [Trichinella zimbabwensis]
MLYPVANQQPNYCRCLVYKEQYKIQSSSLHPPLILSKNCDVHCDTYSEIDGDGNLCGFLYGRNDDMMQCQWVLQN